MGASQCTLVIDAELEMVVPLDFTVTYLKNLTNRELLYLTQVDKNGKKVAHFSRTRNGTFTELQRGKRYLCTWREEPIVNQEISAERALDEDWEETNSAEALVEHLAEMNSSLKQTIETLHSELVRMQNELTIVRQHEERRREILAMQILRQGRQRMKISPTSRVSPRPHPRTTRQRTSLNRDRQVSRRSKSWQSRPLHAGGPQERNSLPTEVPHPQITRFTGTSTRKKSKIGTDASD
jgi:hypothetical protein